MKSSFKDDLSKELSKNLKKYVYTTGISVAKNNRKTVNRSKDSLTTTNRGKANRTNNKRSKVTNDKIIKYLYDRKFYFYSNSFKPSNPNYNIFLRSIKYIFDSNPRRFENAITANVKAYLDKQNQYSNKPSTVKAKKFNRFGIDSRQMQLSLNTTRKR